MTKWFVLGLESSFDDTGTALYDSQLGLMVQLTSSCPSNHLAYGGIVPQVASTNHLKQMSKSLDVIMTGPILKFHSILAIACTKEPGLHLSLMVGLTYTRMLSLILRSEAVYINHTQAHTTSVWLKDLAPAFPLTSLILTGKACSAFYEVSVRTSIMLVYAKDNSVGEVLDKIARTIMMRKGPCGGSCISRLTNGPLTSSWEPQISNCNAQINCSGIKTLILSGVKRWLVKRLNLNRADVFSIRNTIASSTLRLLIKLIGCKARQTLSKVQTNKLIVAGGVSSSYKLIVALNELCNCQIFTAPPLARTDNGAMVAILGFLFKISTKNIKHAN